ncbi:MAG: VOC family protein [Candidatus Binataceae bacterium]
MKASHIHLAVTDLAGALEWLERVWNTKPVFQIPANMAILPFGAVLLFLDQSDKDSRATIGYEVDDCDVEFERLVKLGATVMSPPDNKPYGVRAAYLKGPAALTFEIEQVLKQ